MPSYLKRHLSLHLPLSVCLMLSLLLLQHHIHQIQNGSEPEGETSTNFTLLSVPTDIVPLHPFDDEKPVTVVILSYQRCGSSFLGDIFGKNPDVFFMFEPLDALYSSLYGTAQGWNVPSEITNYKNGSKRIPPEEETLAVAEYLRAILLCKFDSLPTELLVHRYLYNFLYQDDDDYIRCIKNPAILKLVLKCNSLGPAKYCGPRFGEKSEERLRECNMMLSNATYRTQRVDLFPVFRKYLSCRKFLRKVVDKRCVHLLKQSCESRKLRAVKLVRSTMKSMEPLLRTLPNFRVIHLLRDPRPVALSRLKFDPSGISHYGLMGAKKNIMAREAKLFCSTVLRDVRLSSELQQQYPGKIYQVTYEEVMINLKKFTKQLYRFVNSENPIGTTWWKKRIGSKSVNESTITKWKHILSFRENKDIISNCTDFYRFTNYYDELY